MKHKLSLILTFSSFYTPSAFSNIYTNLDTSHPFVASVLKEVEHFSCDLQFKPTRRIQALPSIETAHALARWVEAWTYHHAPTLLRPEVELEFLGFDLLRPLDPNWNEIEISFLFRTQRAFRSRHNTILRKQITQTGVLNFFEPLDLDDSEFSYANHVHQNTIEKLHALFWERILELNKKLNLIQENESTHTHFTALYSTLALESEFLKSPGPLTEQVKAFLNLTYGNEVHFSKKTDDPQSIIQKLFLLALAKTPPIELQALSELSASSFIKYTQVYLSTPSNYTRMIRSLLIQHFDSKFQHSLEELNFSKRSAREIKRLKRRVQLTLQDPSFQESPDVYLTRFPSGEDRVLIIHALRMQFDNSWDELTLFYNAAFPELILQ